MFYQRSWCVCCLWDIQKVTSLESGLGDSADSWISSRRSCLNLNNLFNSLVICIRVSSYFPSDNFSIISSSIEILNGSLSIVSADLLSSWITKCLDWISKEFVPLLLIAVKISNCIPGCFVRNVESNRQWGEKQSSSSQDLKHDLLNKKYMKLL